MLFTYAPSVSQAQRDAIFLRMQAEGLVGCAMSALAAPTLADWRRITSPRRGLLLCCHAAEAGDSLEHFAFETVPVSTHPSGEKRGFRQNPRHVVAATAFASAEQFQAAAVRRRRSLTDGDSIASEIALIHTQAWPFRDRGALGVLAAKVGTAPNGHVQDTDAKRGGRSLPLKS